MSSQSLKDACLKAGAVEISPAEYAARAGQTTLVFRPTQRLKRRRVRLRVRAWLIASSK